MPNNNSSSHRKINPSPTPADPFTAAIASAVGAEIDRLRDELIEIIAGRRQSDVVDTSGLCEYFRISPPTVKKLIADGCPFYVVGEMRRFSIGKVESWLSTRGGDK